MTRLSVRALSLSAAAAVLMLSAPALAATCQQGTFDTFLSAFGKEAAAKGGTMKEGSCGADKMKKEGSCGAGKMDAAPAADAAKK